MANDLKTYGDLKKAIKSITTKQKGEKIAGVAADVLAGFIPGADAAKTTVGFVKALMAKPDNKKTKTWLDKLDVDDKFSKIVDDTVENGFIDSISQDIASKSDDESLDPNFNMNDKLSQYLKAKYSGRTVTGVSEIIREILLEAGFSFTPKKGGVGGRRYIPKFFTLEKSIRDQFSDLIKFYGGVMYVDPQVPIALGYLERGRQSYEKTQNFPSLTKALQDKLPQPIRLAIKKGVEDQKLVNVGDKQMIPLDLEITRDEFGNYLIKNPYTTLDEYKLFLTEMLILEKKNVSNIYQLESLLVTDTSVRNQAEILSDIRSLPGVTIVSTDPLNPSQTVQNKDRVESKLYLKIDPHPFLGKGGFGDEELDSIYSSIKKIKGVTVFRVIGKPIKKTLR